MNNIVIVVSLLTLVITFIYGIVNKYKFGKPLAKAIGALYIVFMIGSTVYAIYKAAN